MGVLRVYWVLLQYLVVGATVGLTSCLKEYLLYFHTLGKSCMFMGGFDLTENKCSSSY